MNARLSYTVTRRACGNCHFVMGEGGAAGPKMRCPTCGHVDFPFLFPETSALHLLDMVEYFHERASERIDDRAAQIEQAITRAVGRIYDRTLVVGTALAAQNVYNQAGQSAWTQQVADQMVQVVETQLGLPSRDDALKALGVLAQYSDTANEEHQAVVVLTCTLLEQLLAGRLIVLAMAHGGMALPDAETQVFDKVQGMRQKQAFFEKRTNVSLRDAIDQFAPTNFWSDWAALRTVRNTFVHERAWAISAASAQTAFELARQAVPVFAEVQNRYCVK